MSPVLYPKPSCMRIVMGLVYISFPVYVMATKPFAGFLAMGFDIAAFESYPKNSVVFVI